MKRYIIALDEGTTGTRAALYDIKKGALKKIVSKPLEQFYPAAGFVEESAAEIYAESLSAVAEIIESVRDVSEIAGIGITNQRETVIMWNKKTGRPIYNAIIWQCRRTAGYAEVLKRDYSDFIYGKTGLIPDAYFSATKIKWLLDNVPEAKKLLEEDNLCVGTVDSFLIYKLTDGKSFVTDATNASRTMLYNIRTLCWDDELLAFFGIPKSILPKVVPCTARVGEFVYAGNSIPICGIAGDQQAALFGQCCFEEGEAKITYGTGLFMLTNAGGAVPPASDKVLTTIACMLGDKVTYALEGSVFNAGSAVQWLRDELSLFKDAAETEKAALSVEDTAGVYVVPAFTGLGAPYWDGEARGVITGLTRGTNKNHIIRAVLEAMAYSARDLGGVMQELCGKKLKVIRADGGASNNGFLMQFQADVLGVAVDKPASSESTALGAAYLCGIGLGLIDIEEIKRQRRTDKLFTPSADREKYDKLYRGWNAAVEKCIYKGVEHGKI